MSECKAKGACVTPFFPSIPEVMHRLRRLVLQMVEVLNHVTVTTR